jgi:hypothetical protein
MAVTFANIIVGEGTLFVGSNTTASLQGAPGAGVTWYDVGGTQEGVMISWEPDMVDIEVDQFGDAARVIQSKVKVMIKTTLAENTFANLALAWGYAAGTSYGDTAAASTETGVQSGNTQMNLGIHAPLPEERQIKVVGPAPGTNVTTRKTRTYTCKRAISVGSVEVGYQRNDNVKLPVEFRILPDAIQTGKEYGTIVDA